MGNNLYVPCPKCGSKGSVSKRDLSCSLCNGEFYVLSNIQVTQEDREMETDWDDEIEREGKKKAS